MSYKFEEDPIFATHSEYKRFMKWRRKFVWTDREKVDYPLAQVSDIYLDNIVKYLRRRVDSMPEEEIDPQGELISNERERERLETLILWLQVEQLYRMHHAPDPAKAGF